MREVQKSPYAERIRVVTLGSRQVREGGEGRGWEGEGGGREEEGGGGEKVREGEGEREGGGEGEKEGGRGK